MPSTPDKTMSFAQTYIFAATIRNKLTKQASNPNSSLRVLVTQANMLDNVMDHLSEETEKRVSKNASSTADDHKHVSFQLPERKREQGISTNVTEYELVSESESDSDSDSYSDDDDQSDSDSDYYYSSDDEEEIQAPSIQIAKVQSFKQLPSMDLSKYSIEEDNEEDNEAEDEEGDEEIPELSRSISLSDDENMSLSDDEDIDASNYTYATDSGYPLHHNQTKENEDSSEKHNLIITRSSDHYNAGHKPSTNTYAIENFF